MKGVASPKTGKNGSGGHLLEQREEGKQQFKWHWVQLVWMGNVGLKERTRGGFPSPVAKKRLQNGGGKAEKLGGTPDACQVTFLKEDVE